MSNDNYYEEQVRNGLLDIDGYIGDKGAQQIALALIHPDTKVQELRLYNSGIGVEGTTALAEALKSNTTL